MDQIENKPDFPPAPEQNASDQPLPLPEPVPAPEPEPEDPQPHPDPVAALQNEPNSVPQPDPDPGHPGPAPLQNEANPIPPSGTPELPENEATTPLPPPDPDPVEPSLPPPVPEPEPEPIDDPPVPEPEPMTADELLIAAVQPPVSHDEAQLKAVLEAVIYVTDEPLSLQQIVNALQLPAETVKPALDALMEDYNRPERGISIREVAGGFKMGTKPEHHEAVRTFVRNLKPPLKLSLAALETLAVIAYKQPITAPEILEIRGVQGAGVLKTLLDRKLITTAGRKNVIGKPILYKTTREFLLQFGLKDLSELPTLKEFEELRRLALTDTAEEPAAETPVDPQPPPPPADEAALSAAAAAIPDPPAEPPQED